MKTLTIRVNDCTDCPYKVWVQGKRRCKISDYRIIDASIGDLPNWCRLDEEESSEWENM